MSQTKAKTPVSDKTPVVVVPWDGGRFRYFCGAYSSVPYQSREDAVAAAGARFPLATVTDAPAGSRPPGTKGAW